MVNKIVVVVVAKRTWGCSSRVITFNVAKGGVGTDEELNGWVCLQG